MGRGGAGAHDLLRMARRGRILDWAGESQYYVEPKRLARLGYLDARREPGKTRERTVYTVTEKGLEALREYATPARLTPVKSDALLRLLIADLVGEAPTRASLDALREDVADLSRGSRRTRRAPARCRIARSTCSWSTTSCGVPRPPPAAGGPGGRRAAPGPVEGGQAAAR